MKQGILKFNLIDRWEISYEDDQSDELSSGSVCEIQVGGAWIKTRIESSGGKYYAVVKGLGLAEGLPARLPARTQ